MLLFHSFQISCLHRQYLQERQKKGGKKKSDHHLPFGVKASVERMARRSSSCGRPRLSTKGTVSLAFTLAFKLCASSLTSETQMQNVRCVCERESDAARERVRERQRHLNLQKKLEKMRMMPVCPFQHPCSLPPRLCCAGRGGLRNFFHRLLCV